MKASLLALAKSIHYVSSCGRNFKAVQEIEL